MPTADMVARLRPARGRVARPLLRAEPGLRAQCLEVLSLQRAHLPRGVIGVPAPRAVVALPGAEEAEMLRPEHVVAAAPPELERPAHGRVAEPAADVEQRVGLERGAAARA